MANMQEETVPCRICGDPTHFTGTRLCNRCWELERRIRMDPAIAKKILEALQAAEQGEV